MTNKRKRRNPARFIIFLLTIAVMIFGIIKLGTGIKSMFSSEKVSLKRVSTVEYIDKKQEEEKVTVDTFNQYVFKFEKDKLNAYSKAGEMMWEKELSIDGDIIIKGNQSTIAAASPLSGVIYYIDYDGNIKAEKSLEKEIVDIKINESGYLLVMLEKEIYVLDADGEIASSFVIPKGEVFDGDLSQDNTKVALNILAVEEKKFYSNILFYSIDGKVLAGKKYDNDVIYKIFLTDTNKLLALGDNKVLMLSEDDEILWEKRFEEIINKAIFSDEELLFLNLVSKKNTIIDTKNKNLIGQLNLDGNILNKIPVAGEIEGLDIIDDTIAVFTNRTIYILGKKGNTILEKKINKDIKNIKWISKKNLLVMYKDKLEIMSINN